MGPQPLGGNLRHHVDEPEKAAGDVRAVHADQGEEGREKGATGRPRALAHHAGKFRDLDKEERRAEQEGKRGKDIEALAVPAFGGQRPEPAGVAGKQ